MKNFARVAVRIAAVALFSIAATACASSADPNSFGAKLAARGGNVKDLGDQWLEGEEQIARGKQLIDSGRDNIGDGEDMVAKGRRQISDGEDLIRRGERAKTEAELTYKTRVAPEPVKTP